MRECCPPLQTHQHWREVHEITDSRKQQNHLKKQTFLLQMASFISGELDQNKPGQDCKIPEWFGLKGAVKAIKFHFPALGRDTFRQIRLLQALSKVKGTMCAVWGPEGSAQVAFPDFVDCLIAKKLLIHLAQSGISLTEHHSELVSTQQYTAGNMGIVQKYLEEASRLEMITQERLNEDPEFWSL